MTPIRMLGATMILRIPPFNRFLPGPIAQVSPRGADRSALGLVRRVNGAVVAVPWGGPGGDWPAGDRFSWRLAFVVAAALLAGCSAPSTADKPGKTEQCSLRPHLEGNVDGAG